VLTGTAAVIAPDAKVRGPAQGLAELHFQSQDHYEELIRCNREIPPIRSTVAHPCDESSLRGALEAAAGGIITPILVGPWAKIDAAAQQFGLDLAGVEQVDVPHSHATAARAVELVRASRAELLMKGSLNSD
jgi:phosphate acetyltransferase